MLYSHTTPGAVARKGATQPSMIAAISAASAGLVTLAMLGGAPAAAGQSSGTAAFVFLVGADTFGIERFTSSTQVLTGDVLLQGQPRIGYLASRGGKGFDAVRVIVYPPGSGPDAAALQSVGLRLVNDTAVAEITSMGATRTERFATQRDALLLLSASVAMLEPAVERLSASGGDSVTFPVFLASGGQTVTATLRRVSSDSVVLQLGPQESHLVVHGTQIVRLRTPAQRLVTERVEGEAAAKLALGKPNYSAPPGAPYRAEPVTVPTPAGHVLAGTLTIPQGAKGRLPAVVTITGSGPEDRDEYLPFVAGYRPFRQVADTLGRRGIIVLRLDDRGTGESTGNFATATSADFADDVRAAVAWLRARPDVNPERIAVLGHSEGGMIGPMVAASDPRIAGVVLMAGPAKRGREVLDYQIRYAVEHDSTIPPSRRDSAFATLRRGADTTAAPPPWMKFFLDYDPLPTIRKVRAPVLILQGATDQQVTADQAEMLGAALREAGNRDVTVRIFPQRNHLFLPDSTGNPSGYARAPTGRIGPEVMGELADWLVKRLR